MEDIMLKNLKDTIGKVAPTNEFKNRSRRLISSSSQNQPAIFNFLKPPFRLSYVIGLASFLLVFVLGGFIYRNISSKTDANFNGAELAREAENLDFQIHLGEAQYFNDSAKEIAAILKEIEQSNSN